MILIDTNVMIDYFRSRDSELAAKIDSLQVGLCGVVRTELIHGARTEEEVDDYLYAFKTFDYLITDDYDWDCTGFMLQTLRSRGLQIPLADAMIALTAIKYDIPLWTYDHHFKFIQGCYPELKLYDNTAHAD
ncbi:MAG: PIN domain-containing protein [Treponemataceae bacterium]|nr:PIN domain-containing protein [Treponemataceae bacterium]